MITKISPVLSLDAVLAKAVVWTVPIEVAELVLFPELEGIGVIVKVLKGVVLKTQDLPILS